MKSKKWIRANEFDIAIKTVQDIGKTVAINSNK